MIVITGGAGFIGSNLAAGLEAKGERDIVVVDQLGQGEKWRNIAKRELAGIVSPDRLFDFLDRDAASVHAVFHFGAASSTFERDADAIALTNFGLSVALWDWCTRHGVRFFYASSAATYGGGEAGFGDDESPEALSRLRPLSAYGWSKHLFDRRVARVAASGRARPPQWVGCKFFNVFGPNEYHKGSMRSVVTQMQMRARAGEAIQIFRSDRADIPAGGQARDFVYVRDCIDMLLWLYEHPDVNGLFNIASGKASSFAELASAVFDAIGCPPRIEYVPIPEAIRGKYQYFTEGPVTKLRKAGYSRPITSLEAGVADYLHAYLATPDPYR